MTAVLEDTDLSWVTFSGGDPAAPCQWRVKGDCLLEAVAVAHWLPVCCEEAISPQRLCAAHRDEVRDASKIMAGRFRCAMCGTVVRLLKLEPIR